VTEELRLERLVVGLRGLALLRAWPFGDADEADRALATIGELAGRDGERLPMDFVDVLGAYTDWAEVYDEPNALIDVEEAALRALVEDLPPGRALDAACGTGRVAAILAELGHEVTGVDPTPAMLERARSRGIRVTFLAGDLAELPVEDGSFDLVTCALALTHVEELGPAIGELARVLRPGGALVISDVHPVAAATGAHAQLKRADGSRAVTRNHVHWPSDYVLAFDASGLRVERCEEPRAGAALFETIANDDVREAAEAGLEGLPFALLWRARRIS
jgi:ubiquinone/menaquinone biosynthesis C-methylase UbiE